MRINTKLIMSASAVLLALIGITLSFFPQEIASYIDTNFSKTLEIFFQLLGALYFAFAMLNWMAKGSVIGGIYNRPIAIANYTHFVIGSLALLKVTLKNADLPLAIYVLAGVYALFAVLFGFIFYKNPVTSKAA
jgi:hypothetical protein